MPKQARNRRTLTAVDFITAYAAADGSEDAIIIPANLEDVSDNELSELAGKAQDAFEQLYEAGQEDGWTGETLEQLEVLTDGIEKIRGELVGREQAAADREAKANELATKVRPADTEGATETVEGEEPIDGEVVEDAEEEEERKEKAPDAPATETAVTASSAARSTRITLPGLRGRRPAAQHSHALAVAAPDVPGFAQGASMDLQDMGRAIADRLTGFNPSSFAAAALAGRSLRNQYSIASIRKDYNGLMIGDEGPEETARILAKAADESRLQGGSLVASGGWCAPSETIYDLFDEGVSRDGIFTLPEVGVSRGGIRFARGFDYSKIFSEAKGFHYTEEQDKAGTYGVDANGIGNGTEGGKPCYVVECNTFDEVRLEVDGLCIQAGLLQRRAYPELIAQAVQLALIAHDHRMADRRVQKIVDGSTAVTMPGEAVGALAPVLDAIEKQVEHYRYVHRMGRGTTLEAVFPFWIHGAIRSDLSRRLGVDMVDVTDARINAWFASRGVQPQFIYNWQDITGDASAFTAWAGEVKFLLYRAGTWVGASSDIISLDTIYDTQLLANNDYTALFTEEGTLVAKRGTDSRVVTVPICPNGYTAAGVEIACNGTAVAEAPVAG